MESEQQVSTGGGSGSCHKPLPELYTLMRAIDYILDEAIVSSDAANWSWQD